MPVAVGWRFIPARRLPGKSRAFVWKVSSALLWYGVTIDTSSAHHLAEGAPTRRRGRLRQTTVAEIKVLAWRQIAEAGAPSLSLRAIARDMGMTSSALYRYFPSRDVLLTALIRDGFASLADTLEAVEASIDSEGEGGRGPGGSATTAGSARSATSATTAGSARSATSATSATSAGSGERFIRIVRAYRAWALSHPSEYALIFGTPVPGLEVHDLDVKEELIRGVNVLFRCMIDGVQRGAIRPPALQGPGAGKLRAKLRAWGMAEAPGLPPAALAGCLFAWTQLHGAISLELFGHMPEEVLPADEFFEQQMRQVLVAPGGTGGAAGLDSPRRRPGGLRVVPADTGPTSRKTKIRSRTGRSRRHNDAGASRAAAYFRDPVARASRTVVSRQRRRAPLGR